MTCDVRWPSKEDPGREHLEYILERAQGPKSYQGFLPEFRWYSTLNPKPYAFGSSGNPPPDEGHGRCQRQEDAHTLHRQDPDPQLGAGFRV